MASTRRRANDDPGNSAQEPERAKYNNRNSAISQQFGNAIRFRPAHYGRRSRKFWKEDGGAPRKSIGVLTKCPSVRMRDVRYLLPGNKIGKNESLSLDLFADAEADRSLEDRSCVTKAVKFTSLTAPVD